MATNRPAQAPKPTESPGEGYVWAYNYNLKKWDKVKAGSMMLTSPPYVQTAETAPATTPTSTTTSSTSPMPARSAASRGEQGIPSSPVPTSTDTSQGQQRRPAAPTQAIDWAGIAKLFEVDPLEAAKEMYGGVMGIVDTNDEIKKLLLDAYNNKWDLNRFVAALKKTDWYRNNRDSAKEFDVIEAERPTEAAALIESKANQIRSAALSKGIKLPDDSINELARNAVRLAWDETTLANAIGAEASKVAGVGGLASGYLGTNARSMANEFGISLSDTSYNKWISDIISGKESEQTYREYLRNLSSTMYPALSDGLSRGLTFAQLTDPYKQQASRILEISESAIDFTDPKFAAAFTSKDDKGNQSYMTYGEWSDYLKTNPAFGYEYTDGAKNDALDIVGRIARLFGAG